MSDKITSGRLSLEDSLSQIISKLSEGNPGAGTVLSHVLNYAGGIDPRDAGGGFGPLLSLDTLGIYGSDIWLLYKDVCKENLTWFVGVLRAVQLGQVSEADVKAAVARKITICPQTLTAQVRARLGVGFEEV